MCLLEEIPVVRPSARGLRLRGIGMFACLTLVAFAVAACDKSPVAPHSVSGIQKAVISVHAADQPFYYYQRSKIYLVSDSDQLVVQSSDGRAVERAQSASQTLGFNVADGGLLLQAPGHRLLRLPQGTPLATLARLRALLQADPANTFVSPVFHTEDDHSLVEPLNRVAVQFRGGVGQSQIDALVQKLGANVIRPPRPDSGFFYYVLSYPHDSIDALRVAAQLDVNPLVQWADPDKISDRRLASVPTDAYFPLQFHLANTNVLNGVTVDLDVERAWDLSVGTGIKMGIADDGFDFTQPDYEPVFGGANGDDEMTAYAGPGEGIFTPYCNDTHGTSVLGIVGAGQNNGGVAGIAPGVVLEGVRIFRNTYPCPGNAGPPQNASDQQIADGLNWLWQWAHADVMSNSWGGGAPSNLIASAITNAVTMGRSGRGTPVFFAAGNYVESARLGGSPGAALWPATLSNVISVSAIDRFGNITAYAPRGKVDVVAVSGAHTGTCIGEIVTTDHEGSPGCSDGPGGDINYTTTFSGTSAATPQVAAVAALMLARYPNLTATQVYARIKSGAIPWGRSDDFGAGKVSAYNAIF